MNTTFDIRLTDTTLRDGSHAMSHKFTEAHVRSVARALDDARVEVIEVTHGDGLGGSRRAALTVYFGADISTYVSKRWPIKPWQREYWYS